VPITQELKSLIIYSTHIKNLTNERQVIKKTLKRFLPDNSFYSIHETFNANKLYTFLIVMIS